MEVSVIELVIYLTEHMVKDIFTLKRRLAVVFGLKLNILDVAFGKIDLLDTFAGDDEQVLTLLVGSHTAAHPFEKDFGVAFLRVADKEVGAALGGVGHIVELVSFRGKEIVADKSGASGQAAGAVFAVVKIEFKSFDLILLVSLFLGFLIFLPFLGTGLLLILSAFFSFSARAASSSVIMKLSHVRPD